MPVVAVPLDYQTVRGHERINTELPADDVLSLVQHADSVEDRVSSYLDFVWISRLLHGVHSNQHCPSRRVNIPAFQGTIRNVLRLPRRRPSKRIAAHLAGVGVLVSALPFIRMAGRTEVGVLTEPTGSDIDRPSTNGTGKRLPRLTARLRAGSVAIERTVFLSCPHMPRDNLVAIDAGDGSHLVSELSFHTVNYTRNTATRKPMEFM